jgi:hypothetical protein
MVMKKIQIQNSRKKKVPYQESKNPMPGGAGPNNGVLGGGGGGGGGGGSITYLQWLLRQFYHSINM